MSKKKDQFSHFLLMTQVIISSGFIFSFFPLSVNAKAESIIINIRPTAVKQHNLPDPSGLKQKELMSRNLVRIAGDDIFQIEASDAIDGIKYSQPDIPYSLFSSESALKVPSSTFMNQKFLQNSAEKFQEPFSYTTSQKNPIKPLRDMRYIDSAVDDTRSDTSDSSQKLNNNFENILQTYGYDRDDTNFYTHDKSNFTDASDTLVSVSSDTVLSYDVPSSDFNESIGNISVKEITNILNDVPSLNSSDINSTTLSVSKPVEPPEHLTENSVSFGTHMYTNISKLNESIISTSIFPSTYDENVTNSLPSIDSEGKLSSGTVAGIVIAVLVSVTLLSSAVIYLLYRKFNGRCTSAVESKFNTDNCGYLDDSLRSSIYLNNHIELPKESSEEMTSLDNDSFLNSLETMTIQNYWADNSKNTKV